MTRKVTILTILALILASSCTAKQTPISSPTPSPKTNQTLLLPTPSRETSSTQLPTYTQTSTPIQTSDSPIFPNGPWVIVNAVDGLWLMNTDGTGLTRIVEAPVYQFAVSSDQRTVAYVTDSDFSDDFAGLDLMVLALPSGPAHVVASLQNPAFWSDFSDDTLTDTEQAMRAIMGSPPAWSPDGSRIAFISQAEGLSADLYVYKLKDQTTTRLTDGPSQAYHPVWSPDGRFIFHIGVWHFGTGAGYVNAGSWVVPVDGSTIQKLPDEYGTDEFIEWILPRKILLASWSQPCGIAHLRTYDITTSASQEIWPYCFNDIAVSKPSNRILIAVPAEYAQFSEPPQPTGVFLFHSPSSDAQLITDQNFERVVPHPFLPDAFLIPGSPKYYELTSTDALNLIPGVPPAVPIPNPQNNLWLWESVSYYAPGLWVSPISMDSTPRKIISTFVDLPLWEPSGTGFFFIDSDKDRLFVARGPAFTPLLVSEKLILSWDSKFVIVDP